LDCAYCAAKPLTYCNFRTSHITRALLCQGNTYVLRGGLQVGAPYCHANCNQILITYFCTQARRLLSSRALQGGTANNTHQLRKLVTASIYSPISLLMHGYWLRCIASLSTFIISLSAPQNLVAALHGHMAGSVLYI